MKRRYKNGFSLRVSWGPLVPVAPSMSLLPLQKEWFFHWDHAQVAITPFLKKWFADHSIVHLWHSTGHQALLLWIFSFLEGEGGPDGPLPGQRQPHRDLGRSHHDHRCWWVCYRGQAVVRVPWEVYSNRHRIHKEKLNNQHSPSFNTVVVFLFQKSNLFLIPPRTWLMHGWHIFRPDIYCIF